MFLKIRNRRKTVLTLLVASAVLQGCGNTERANEPLAVSVDAVQAQKLEELHRTADEFYREASEGDYVTAREKLIQFSTMVTSVSFEGVTSVEGVDQLTRTVVQAKRDFNSVKASPDHAMQSAAKLKLAADALTHPNQPMWLQYYKVLSDDTRLLEEALMKKNGKEAAVSLARLIEHYDTIRPAVWISRAPEEGEKMDSLLTFFQGELKEDARTYDKITPVIPQWKEALDELFRRSQDKTAYIPVAQPDDPIRWSLTIGSVILAALGYSAWKMFQSERNYVKTARRFGGK